MKKEVILIFGMILFLAGSITAVDFTITGVSAPSDIYQGDSPTLTAQVSASSGNLCDMECVWQVNKGPDYSGYVSGNGKAPSTVLKKGENEIFPFRVNAEGDGKTNFVISVACTRIPNYINCWPGQSSGSYSSSFNFSYSGDSICTILREKCADYQNYTGTDDCRCDYSEKECRPDSIRTADNYGCATFCGNSIFESEFENCSGCPADAGKCDGVNCFFKEECRGGFCVHQKCWSEPYIKGDRFCDNSLNENCKNSFDDCKCEIYERCGSLGTCETYCGNMVCEKSERGICLADCKWCGDTFCSENENCISCSDDCRQCETEEETTQAIEQIKNIQENVESSLGKAEEEIEKTNKEIESTKSQINRTQEEISRTQEEINKTQSEIAKAMEQLREAEQKRLDMIFYAIMSIIIVVIIYVLIKLANIVK